MSRTKSKVKTVVTTTPDGQTTSTTTVFGGKDKEAVVSVEADGDIVGGGGLRANNYDVQSTMPPDNPVRRADTIPLEELASHANEEGLVKFCRCWKSKTFPLCDNSHLDHNEECGDNAAPVVISGFEPILRQYANNGGVKSTVPPDDPTKRVDMLSVAEIGAKVRADGDVKFCRCWKSSNFPFCDDSHDSHNDACEATGSRDNAAPVVLTTGLPEEQRGLDKVQTLPDGSEPLLDESLAGTGRANNYNVPSNMPPGQPTKRVEIIDIEDIEAEVAAAGEVKFCRCWRSSTFPFCDGSHDGHNLHTGDNTGPVVLLPDAKM